MPEYPNNYTGSHQEYLDDMDRDDDPFRDYDRFDEEEFEADPEHVIGSGPDLCPGCGRPADVNCHPACLFQQPCPSE
jgi:hypothetical protein